MTSNLNSQKSHDFLVIAYNQNSFLVNRNQFFSSSYLSEVEELSEKGPFISSLMKYNEELILVFILF